MLFHDRTEAGRRLAALLDEYRGEHALVIALPRGGLPVGYEVARALDAELDVLVVRKLGAPMQPELGLGAIAEGGSVYVDVPSARMLGVSHDELAEIAQRETVELERRVRLYRGTRPTPTFTGRTVILVDDGVATGGTMRAAIRAVREQHPRKLIVAVPVIAASSAAEIEREVDEVVCVRAPEHFGAVGYWYDEFPQTSDDEVLSLLKLARAGAGEPSHASESIDPSPVVIEADEGPLHGLLGVPQNAQGIVLFAHGSGSSRHSRRNQHVARVLREQGLATLLLDLLTPAEESEDELTGQLRFDIELLAQHLLAATRWVAQDPRLERLPIGYFGASTGAAAAIVAAGRFPGLVRAVVSRGGRPDLAGKQALARVGSPVLLIVGEHDPVVLDLNREAMALLPPSSHLVIVPGATHLFEEAGALDAVADLAANWLRRHLAPARAVAQQERSHV